MIENSSSHRSGCSERIMRHWEKGFWELVGAELVCGPIKRPLFSVTRWPLLKPPETARRSSRRPAGPDQNRTKSQLELASLGSAFRGRA
jgi:hypothetical protein